MPVLVNVCAMDVPEPAACPVIVPPAGVVWIAAVQVKLVPLTAEFNDTLLVAPLQIVSGEAEPTGVGSMATSTVKLAPGQPLAVGVTV